MAGLGKYSIRPDMFGGITVKHDVKELCGDYPNEIVFKSVLQKSDWQRMMMALLSLLGIANKINDNAMLSSNPARTRYLQICVNYAKEIPRDKPNVIAEKIAYVVDYMPMLAQTKYPTTNADLLAEIAIVKEYYTRYLAKWETYNNPLLTA